MFDEKIDDIRPHIIKISDLFDQLGFFKHKNDELKKLVSDLEEKLKSSTTVNCNSIQNESDTEALLMAKQKSEEKIVELQKNFENEKTCMIKTYQDLLVKHQKLQFNFDMINSSSVKVTEENNNDKLMVEKLLIEKKKLQERLKSKEIERFELESSWKDKFEDFKKNLELEQKKNSDSQLEQSLNECIKKNSSLNDQIQLLESNCENLKTQLRISHENNLIAPILLSVNFNDQMSPVTELPGINLTDFTNSIPSPLPEIKSDKSTISPCRSLTPKLQESISVVSSIESKYDINNIKNRARIKRRRIISRQNRTSIRFRKRKAVQMIRGANRLKIFLESSDKDVLFVDCDKRRRNIYEFRNITDQYKMFQNWRQQCSSSSNMFTPMPMIPYNFMNMGINTQCMPPFMSPFMNVPNNMTHYPMMFQPQPDYNQTRHKFHKSKKSHKRPKSPQNVDNVENHDNSKLPVDICPVNQPLSEDNIVEPEINLKNESNSINVKLPENQPDYTINNDVTISDDKIPQITKVVESVTEKRNNKKINKVSKLNRIRNKLTQLSLNNKIAREIQLKRQKIKVQRRKKFLQQKSSLEKPQQNTQQQDQDQNQEQKSDQIKTEEVSTKKIKSLNLKTISKTPIRTEGFKRSTMKRSCTFTNNEPVTKKHCSDRGTNCENENNIQETEQEIEPNPSHDITLVTNCDDSDKIDPISVEKPLLDNETKETSKVSPLKKCKKLNKLSIGNLLSNYINNINNGASDLINDIIETLSTVNISLLKNSIMNMMEKNLNDELDKTYTPPAPALPAFQQKLILLVSKLETRAGLKDLFDECLKFIENRIRRKTSLDSLLSLSRFFMAVCKLKNNIYRLRSYCLSVMYHQNIMSIPVWFLVLTQWSEVLPKANFVKNTPLVWVVIHFIKNCKVSIPKYKMDALRKLILNYYEYNEQRYSYDDLLKQLLDLYKNNNSLCCEFSIALLFKIQNKTWAKNQIIKKIVPLAQKDNQFKNLINHLTVQFDSYDFFNEIKNQLP